MSAGADRAATRHRTRGPQGILRRTGNNSSVEAGARRSVGRRDNLTSWRKPDVPRRPPARGGRREIRTKRAPAPGGHYAQAVAANGAIYVSGSGPFDPAPHRIVGRDIETQTAQTLDNVRAILEAAGASMADVVKVTVFLRRIGDFTRMDRIYAGYFPARPPARTTVAARLYGTERLITIDAIAARPPARRPDRR